jgi:hypothetical protein
MRIILNIKRLRGATLHTMFANRISSNKSRCWKKAVSTAAALSIFVSLALTATSYGGDDSSELRFSDGRFEPAMLTLPANHPVKLQVTNAGNAAFEFESFELHRERVVQPGQTVTVYIPALKPGTYQFFDDFNRAAASGRIVAR